MLKKSRLVCGILIGAMMFASLTGCGSSSGANTNTFTYEDESEEAPVSQDVMAMVQSIDGSKITVSVMGGRGGNMQKGGEMPEGESVPEMDSTEMGERPEGMTPPEEGSTEMGEAPAEKGEMHGGKTAVLTVGDESVILVDNESGSLSDIKEGSMLKITFDENGNVISINVSEAMMKPEKNNSR